MCSEHAETDAATEASPAAPTTPGTVAAALQSGHADAALDPPASVSGLSLLLDFTMRAAANIRYHEDRQGFLDAAARWTNFAVVMGGSGAASTAFAGSPTLTLLTGILTAMIGAAQLVFDFSGKARSHLELRKAFIRLLAEASRPDPDLSALNVDMTLLLGDEPPIFFAVHALAYNSAQLGYGRDEDTLLEVTDWQRLVRHIWRFEPAMFKTRDERLAAAQTAHPQTA